MKKFYILKENNVIGPYSAEELKDKNLKVNSLLCEEGTEDWKKFSEFEELKLIKGFLPPPPPPRSNDLKARIANALRFVFSKAYLSKLVLLIIACLLIGLISGWGEYSGKGSFYSKTYHIHQCVVNIY